MADAMATVGGDGFLLTTPVQHLSRRYVTDITEGLVPALRDLGVVRESYEYPTLRENLLRVLDIRASTPNRLQNPSGVGVRGGGSRWRRRAAWAPRWRDPFGLAVGPYSGVPATGFDEVVVGWASQGEVVDVGVAAVLPVFGGVVDHAVIPGRVAAGSGAATIFGVQNDSLIGRSDAFGSAQPQRLPVDPVEQGQIVVGVAGHPDQVRDRQQGAAGGDRVPGLVLQVWTVAVAIT